MSLKPLIKNQTLIIDDHKRGAREQKNWDSNTSDIHIDKKTKYKLDGKLQEVRIRIPINSNKPISVTSRNKNIPPPQKLVKEIKKAFSNKDIREKFIRDLVDILDNFSSNLDSLEKARVTLERIAKHFGLKWTKQEIDNYLKNSLIKLIRIYEDEEGKQYYIEIDKKKIKIGNIDKWF